MKIRRYSHLRIAPARGRIVVGADVIHQTADALTSFCDAGGDPHEGLVYWAGRRIAESTLVMAAIAPAAKHESLRVIADERAIGFVARAARSQGLGIVAQVHSHPNRDTNHSIGDNQLVLMPFEGMFSIVVADYGRGSLEPGASLGVHEFQGGRWIRVRPLDSKTLTIVPALIDLRS
jgi:proteasome lid subunit RPN8/RPN11